MPAKKPSTPVANAAKAQTKSEKKPAASSESAREPAAAKQNGLHAPARGPRRKFAGGRLVAAVVLLIMGLCVVAVALGMLIRTVHRVRPKLFAPAIKLASGLFSQDTKVANEGYHSSMQQTANVNGVCSDPNSKECAASLMDASEQGDDNDENEDMAYGDSDDEYDDDDEYGNDDGHDEPEELPDDGTCKDRHADCPMWGSNGECDKNPSYMLQYCKQSCGLCKAQEKRASARDYSAEDSEEDDDEDEDDDEVEYGVEAEDEEACVNMDDECEFWAENGECEANPSYMDTHCAKACKLCVANDEDDYHADDDDDAPMDEADGNVQVVPITTSEGEVIKIKCKDRHNHASCQQRAAEGQCQSSSPGWMLVMCAESCKSCEMLDPAKRCAPENMGLPNPIPNGYKPGDLKNMFESLSKRYGDKVEYLSVDPYVVVIRDFVSDLEGQTILDLTVDNLERSTDQGQVSPEGIQEKVVSQGRTSMNAWCQDSCMEHPIVANLTSRISELVRLPVLNFESYQVLRYTLGQKYDVHHDESDDAQLTVSGPRAVVSLEDGLIGSANPPQTFFLYLSDVEEGGETFFPKLNISVKPRKGSALLWPSVLSDNPERVDERTSHAALPVKRGDKFAANVWVHLRDFVTANRWGCTGSYVLFYSLLWVETNANLMPCRFEEE